jgi:hypothetical protein
MERKKYTMNYITNQRTIKNRGKKVGSAYVSPLITPWHIALGSSV